MKFFLFLKKMFYCLFVFFSFFFQFIFFLVCFFVPKWLRRSLIRKQYRLINCWLNVSEPKKEVILFFFIVVMVLFFLGLVQVFIIKIKFLFLIFFFIYVGGGLFVIFLYWCVLTYPSFSILAYPVLDKFVNWYVSNFTIYSGKISGPCWDVFFWYLRVIHTPISRFMKRDTSYERHFFISLAAISFVGYLFYIVPSFITEGLDPLCFFFIFTRINLSCLLLSLFLCFFSLWF